MGYLPLNSRAWRSTVGPSCPRLSSILIMGFSFVKKTEDKFLQKGEPILVHETTWTWTFAAQVDSTQQQDRHSDFLHEESKAPASAWRNKSTCPSKVVLMMGESSVGRGGQKVHRSLVRWTRSQEDKLWRPSCSGSTCIGIFINSVSSSSSRELGRGGTFHQLLQHPGPHQHRDRLRPISR